MASLVVSRARPAEVSVVAGVLAEAAAWLTARGESLWDPSELSAETLEPDVHAGHYFIGRVGDSAAGVLRLTPEDRTFWPEDAPGVALYVHRLAVRRSAAGGAVSSALLAWAANEACARDCSSLKLDCVFDRARLRAVYERFGFRFHSEFRTGPYHVARYVLDLGRRSGG